MNRLNAFLDALPRTRLGRASREVPAFRACGVAGFHFAVAAVLGGGLLAGRSLPVLAVLALACALSFFGYTFLRRAVTGREALVLLEHVWVAEACCAATLAALGEPVLPYMDVIGVALAVFLTGGRVGCLLAGCCHGRPSALGIAYPERHARDGFPAHWAGVRLFPVQAVEALGLAFIAVTGLVALPFARPGYVFAWFLAGYAVLRFGTEGLRGDRRPHWLGLSVPRWMALAELGVALWIARGPGPPERDAALLAMLAAALVASLAVARAFDRRRHLLAPAHLRELREIVRTTSPAPATTLTEPAEDDDGAIPLFGERASAGSDALAAPPRAMRTVAGVSIAVSPHPGQPDRWRLVSLSLADGARDVEGLCRMAAAALPSAHAASARMEESGVLYLALPALPVTAEEWPVTTGDALYAAVARRLQAAAAPRAGEDAAEAPVSADAVRTARAVRPAYFGREG
jgi:hypothetical protein